MSLVSERVRGYVCMCSRIELDRAMEEARLTEQQREVIELMFTRGLSVVAIKLRCNMDESTVKRILARSYDKIYNVIM